MSQGTFRELSKWLQSKTAGSNGVTVGNADSPKQAAQLIADHWKNVWSDHDTTVQQASSALTHDFGPVQNNIDWVEISEGDLLSAVRRAKGSAGPDHWAGSEVQFLPSKAIAVWHQIISRQWHVAQKLPNQLKESRQVSLPKTNKIKNGFLEPGSTRPITVLSVWWRVYASAVLQSQSVQSWYSQNLHPDVCYGKGSPGAEILAQVLQDTLAEKSGFLACMDWKQAYDRMRPAVTVICFETLTGRIIFVISSWRLGETNKDGFLGKVKFLGALNGPVMLHPRVVLVLRSSSPFGHQLDSGPLLNQTVVWSPRFTWTIDHGGRTLWKLH